MCVSFSVPLKTEKSRGLEALPPPRLLGSVSFSASLNAMSEAARAQLLSASQQSYIHRETKSFASLGRFLEDLLKGTSSLLSQRQITPLRIQLSRLHSGEWERLHVDLLIFNNDFQFSKISIQVNEKMIKLGTTVDGVFNA